MSSAVYLGQRFLYRVLDFLRHWYADSFYFISRQTVNVLEILDRRLAFRISLRYWLKPLYQDYTPLGYVLGFILRTFRIIAGGFVYISVVILAAALYLAWAAIPFYAIYTGL